MEQKQTKLGLIGLIAIVVGGVIGGGIFNIPKILVNISVIIAVAGAWLVATIIASELPAQAAKDHVLPRFFAHYNKRGAPVSALLITSCLIQVFLFLVVQVHNVYIFFVDLSGIMILPTYILSAMFLVKAALKKRIYADHPIARQFAIIIGTGTALYCFWVIYAGNIRFLLLSSVVYLLGIIFYRLTFRQNISGKGHLFTIMDRYFIGLLSAAMIFPILWEWGYFI